MNPDATRNAEALCKAGFRFLPDREMWILQRGAITMALTNEAVQEYSYTNLRTLIAGSSLVEIPWIATR